MNRHLIATVYSKTSGKKEAVREGKRGGWTDFAAELGCLVVCNRGLDLHTLYNNSV